MKTVNIYDRWTGATIYTAEVDDDDAYPIRTAIETAIRDGASLVGASLVGARLVGASLVGASLDGARLDRASLVGASLSGASLVGASLDGARLDRASLVGASLVGASLVGASLDGASLDGASLDAIRDDLRAVLDLAPAEVPGLLAALDYGRIDGSVYQGDCACLVGTIAKVRGCDYQALGDLMPSSGRPAERWFLGIGRGHTPDTDPVAAITRNWIVEWQAERGEGELITGASS